MFSSELQTPHETLQYENVSVSDRHFPPSATVEITFVH